MPIKNILSDPNERSFEPSTLFQEKWKITFHFTIIEEKKIPRQRKKSRRDRKEKMENRERELQMEKGERKQNMEKGERSKDGKKKKVSKR